MYSGRVPAVVFLSSQIVPTSLNSLFFTPSHPTPWPHAGAMPKVHLLPGQLDHGRAGDVSRGRLLRHRRTVHPDSVRRGLLLPRAGPKHNIRSVSGLVFLPGGHVVADREYLRDWQFLRGRQCGSSAVHARVFLQYERTFGPDGSVPGGQGKTNNMDGSHRERCAVKFMAKSSLHKSFIFAQHARRQFFTM
jgi:hypothetical protein